MDSYEKAFSNYTEKANKIGEHVGDIVKKNVTKISKIICLFFTILFFCIIQFCWGFSKGIGAKRKYE